ncbi:MAG TPA: low-complexity tail membrane protein [Nostocaceae cyanobacterium]|nr:low-complexity tail membrane protein [Nostocaceae cyanobacterium]
MSSFRSEPILWVHVAGLVTLPFFMALCLFCLSIGEPLFPVWQELLLVAAIGTLPLVWMQLHRPFYIFAILGIALKPEQLTEQQRKILCLIKRKLNKFFVLIAALLLTAILWQLYQVVPLLAKVAKFLPPWHSLGLLFAALAFMASNLFLQIPLSVARVLVTNDTEFAATEPLNLEEVKQYFTIFGVQVNHILPPVNLEVKNKE